VCATRSSKDLELILDKLFGDPDQDPPKNDEELEVDNSTKKAPDATASEAFSNN